MNNLIQILILLSFVTESRPAFANRALSANVGTHLSDVFQCDSQGSRTEQVMVSLGKLKNAIAEIKSDEGRCKELATAVGDVNTVNEMLAHIESDKSYAELRSLQGNINNIVADLKALQNGADPTLFPTSNDLQEQLGYQLREYWDSRQRLSVDRIEKRANAYASGVAQLQSYSQKISAALEKNDCSENPEIRRNAIAGVAGIAGIFMSHPIGLATLAGADVLHSLISSIQNKNQSLSQVFAAANDATLVNGMSCALKELNHQQCQIFRQSYLVKQLTEAGVCSDCQDLAKQAESSQTAFSNLEELRAWAEERDRLKAPATVGDEKNDVRVVFKQRIRAMTTALSELRSQTLILTPEEFRKKVIDILGIYDHMLDLHSPMPDTKDLPQTSSVTANSVVSIVMPLSFSTSRLIFKDYADWSRQFPLIFAEIVNQPMPAYTTYNGIVQPTPLKRESDLLVDVASGIGTGPKVKALMDRLADVSTIRNIEQNLIHVDDLFDTATTAHDFDDFNRFALVAGNPTSPLLRSLSNLNNYFDGMDPAFFESREGSLTNASAIRGSLQAQQKFLSESAFSVSNPYAVVAAVYGTESAINYRFFDGITVVLDTYRGYQNRQLTDSKDRTSEFFAQLSNDAIRESLNIRSEQEQRAIQSDLARSKTVSAGQLDAFGKFFNPYFSRAFDFLNGKGLTEGMKASIDPLLKTQFCMHLLGLTDRALISKIEKQCKDEVFNLNGKKIPFTDLVHRPFQDRVCTHDLYSRH